MGYLHIGAALLSSTNAAESMPSAWYVGELVRHMRSSRFLPTLIRRYPRPQGYRRRRGKMSEITHLNCSFANSSLHRRSQELQLLLPSPFPSSSILVIPLLATTSFPTSCTSLEPGLGTRPIVNLSGLLSLLFYYSSYFAIPPALEKMLRKGILAVSTSTTQALKTSWLHAL